MFATSLWPSALSECFGWVWSVLSHRRMNLHDQNCMDPEESNLTERTSADQGVFFGFCFPKLCKQISPGGEIYS